MDSLKRSLDSSSDAVKRQRRRYNGWDIAPTGLTQPGAAPQPVAVPVHLPVAASSSNPLLAAASLPLSAGSLSLNPALRLAARIYVGSIYYHINEDILRLVFAPFGPIIKIDVPKEAGRSKGFAFIEFSSVEASMAAVRVMNGAPLHGRPMKLGRPPGVSEDPSYLPAALQMISKLNVAMLQNPATNPALNAGMTAATSQIIPGQFPGAPLAVSVPPESTSSSPSHSAASPSNAAQQAFNPTIPLISPSAVAASAVITGSVPAQIPLLPSNPSASSGGLSKTRVYVGNLAWELTEEHIRAVFDAVGKIKSLQLVMDPATNKHRGYCFIDFEDEKSAAVAIQMGQAGFQIMGRALKVNYAAATATVPSANGLPNAAIMPISGIAPQINGISVVSAVPSIPGFPSSSQPVPSSSAAAILNAASQSLFDPNASVSPAAPTAAALPVPLSIPGLTVAAPNPNALSISREENLRISSHSQRSQLMSKLMKKPGGEPAATLSPVILLKNLVSPTEVDSQLEGEVSMECSKFGQVVKVKIHTDTLLEKVYIYVEFASIEEATKAQESLNGRWFNYRTVQANYYPKFKFDAAIYTDAD